MDECKDIHEAEPPYLWFLNRRAKYRYILGSWLRWIFRMPPKL